MLTSDTVRTLCLSVGFVRAWRRRPRQVPALFRCPGRRPFKLGQWIPLCPFRPAPIPAELGANAWRIGDKTGSTIASTRLVPLFVGAGSTGELFVRLRRLVYSLRTAPTFSVRVSSPILVLHHLLHGNPVRFFPIDPKVALLVMHLLPSGANIRFGVGFEVDGDAVADI